MKKDTVYKLEFNKPKAEIDDLIRQWLLANHFKASNKHKGLFKCSALQQNTQTWFSYKIGSKFVWVEAYLGKPKSKINVKYAHNPVEAKYAQQLSELFEMIEK